MTFNVSSERPKRLTRKPMRFEPEFLQDDAPSPAPAPASKPKVAARKSTPEVEAKDEPDKELPAEKVLAEEPEPLAQPIATADYTEDQLRGFSLSSLKNIARGIGLSLGGKKDELIERIVAGVPEYEVPSRITYEWDPQSRKADEIELVIQERSPSSRAACIRCLQKIQQGMPRVGFGHWDHQRSKSITRYVHLPCFARYPFFGLSCFDDANWSSKIKQDKRQKIYETEKMIPLLRGMWSPVCDDLRVTSDELRGLKAERDKEKSWESSLY